MYSDLNDFIADLDKRGLLSRIRESVNPDLEIAALTDRVCKLPGGGPGLLFERPTGFDMPVATNLFGSTERMCLALGVGSLDSVAKDIDEMMTPKVPSGMLDAFKMLPMLDRLRDLMPRTVKDAACQEVVKRDGSLDELPILKTWPEDGGRYITFPLVITKDPETGVRNIGTYRMQVFDGRTTGMHWQRHKGGAQHHRVAERLGKRLEEVAVGRDKTVEGFRKLLEPLRLTLKTQAYLGGEKPNYADYIVFGPFQLARLVSPFKLLAADDQVYAWRERLLDAFDGMARKTPGYPV